MWDTYRGPHDPGGGDRRKDVGDDPERDHKCECHPHHIGHPPRSGNVSFTIGVRVIPRNGAGVYSLPESPFVDGTTISAAPVNNDFSDIATALTGSVAADGQTPMTGTLVGTTATFSGVVTAADGLVDDRVVNNSQFERDLPTSNGDSMAQVYPGGGMMQSGTVLNVAASQTVTFPLEFVFVSAVVAGSGGPVGNKVSVASYTTKNFVLEANGAGAGIHAFWIATGTRF